MSLHTDLLTWYQHNQRALPWRGQTDPYKIWISEVMLQQTQVSAVIPYYQRFVAQFPTVQSLAHATLDEVLKQWAGLGYYTRARNLHRAAQKITTDYNGLFPPTAHELRRLPGFGEYTAAAVASIAFAQPVAAIDGNVKRVLSRLFAVETDITRQPALGQIRQIAKELAAATLSPADWTQSLMELGAIVCLPAAPRCLLCPLAAEWCRARAQGIAESLPLKPQKLPIPHYNVAAAVIYRDTSRREFLIAQRPLQGMLGGLWEFPGGKQETGESLPECLRREIFEELALNINVGNLITSINHAFTHFKITLHAFTADRVNTVQQPQIIDVANWAWTTLAEVDRYAFGRTDQKIIAILRQQNPLSS